MQSSLVKVLSERGFIQQATDLDGLDELATKPLTAYIGFDCTASSLHVGSLIQLRVLHWLKKLGHDPICLLGFATTQVGDPTGKDTARPMLSNEVIHNNLQGIKRTVERIVPGVRFIKNDLWFNSMWSFVNVMRDIGPHMSVNKLVKLDVFERRLTEQNPLSLLEFCYPMMQAVDFLELFRSRDNVRLQIGGSDQWGNILGGIELIHKIEGGKAFGLTTPLLTDSSGKKMGKTATGETIWLDAARTPPFAFWQFWRNVEDDKVKTFLHLFTDYEPFWIEHGFGEFGPGMNEMKKLLATEVTALVHGEEVAEDCRNRAEQIFEHGATEFIEPTNIPFGERSLADVLLIAGLVTSKGDATRLAAGGGIRLNGEQISNVRDPAPSGDFVLTVGKKKMARIVHI